MSIDDIPLFDEPTVTQEVAHLMGTDIGRRVRVPDMNNAEGILQSVCHYKDGAGKLRTRMDLVGNPPLSSVNCQSHIPVIVFGGDPS